MKNRVDFVTPTRQSKAPYLSNLLDGTIYQKVFLIEYESRKGKSSREIQPIGIYASNGLWYCPAYCFDRNDFRVFRCDRIHTAVYSTSILKSLDLRHVDPGNVKSLIQKTQEDIQLYVELSKEGVQKCEAELWLANRLHIRKDGAGWIDDKFAKSDIPFLAKFFIGLAEEATVKNPPELVDCIKQTLSKIMAKYA